MDFRELVDWIGTLLPWPTRIDARQERRRAVLARILLNGHAVAAGVGAVVGQVRGEGEGALLVRRGFGDRAFLLVGPEDELGVGDGGAQEGEGASDRRQDQFLACVP